ncbi:Gemin2 [Scenedesmus sp. PABB004]|nr:Gemin2 [Scenedesmus sp. PABB004]
MEQSGAEGGEPALEAAAVASSAGAADAAGAAAVALAAEQAAQLDDDEDELDDDADDASSDEDYNQRNFGIFQALPVEEGEPDWSLGAVAPRRAPRRQRGGGAAARRGGAARRRPTCGAARHAGEPDSAEEYLRRVRFEAARCPKARRAARRRPGGDAGSLPAAPGAADALPPRAPPPRPPQVVRVEPAAGALDARPTKRLPQPQPIADAPDWAKPSRSWVQKFVSDFQALRLEVAAAYAAGAYPAAAVPHLRDVDAWDRACFGSAAQAEALGVAAAAGDGAAGAELTQLTPGICAKIMALQPPDVVALFLRHAAQLEEHCPADLPLLRAQWLFALAARLEKPCDADVAAGFRAVLRHCCRLRARVAAPGDPLLPKLNVLIVTAGAYFAQDERLCGIVDASELP